MKTLLKKLVASGNYPNTVSTALLLLRISVGIMMLTHGIGKFSRLFGDAPITFADPLGVGVTASLALTVFAEVFCSVFLIIGFATRFSAITLLITMLVVVFIVHGNDGFGKQELPLLYATGYLVLLLAGAGKLSIDNWLYSKIKNL